MQYTSEQFQQLSAKVSQLTVELSTVRREREALQASAAAPAVSTGDRLTAFSEEMLKMTKQNEDLRAEITALRSQEGSPRPASEDTTTMFRELYGATEGYEQRKQSCDEGMPKTISNVMMSIKKLDQPEILDRCIQQ